MLARLFPKQLDAGYQGSAVALWLLAPVLLVKTLMAANLSGLNPLVSVADILQTVDGVPLDTFTQEARTVVVDSASAWGAALLALCVVVWLFALRYRAALPLGILLLLLEQVVRAGPGMIEVVAGVAAGTKALSLAASINLGITLLLVISLCLSLLRIRRGDASPAGN